MKISVWTRTSAHQNWDWDKIRLCWHSSENLPTAAFIWDFRRDTVLWLIIYDLFTFQWSKWDILAHLSILRQLYTHLSLYLNRHKNSKTFKLTVWVPARNLLTSSDKISLAQKTHRFSLFCGEISSKLMLTVDIEPLQFVICTDKSFCLWFPENINSYHGKAVPWYCLKESHCLSDYSHEISRLLAAFVLKQTTHEKFQTKELFERLFKCQPCKLRHKSSFVVNQFV